MRDPIGTFESYLMEDGPPLDGRRRAAKARREANRNLLEEAEARVLSEVEEAEKEALVSRSLHMPEPAEAVVGVYASAVSIGGRA